MPFQQLERNRRINHKDIKEPTLQLGKSGVITINPLAYKLLREPTAVLVHYDLDAGLLGLEKAAPTEPNSFKVSRLKTGSASIRIEALFNMVAEHYSTPIRAVARFHTDTILAAPILPQPTQEAT